ncbi:hypothetical protein E1301_Tti009713 [Triplophysa tibetana]|uniref:LITAF domain-containing protein n=1 Tax=Triplophysa tibetana TaxID=1572043 RepID=A0A5A9N5Z1_9TELE|nr:hypothetical protein E1301_Tti009713 [Triplophysa tibetana]
MRQDRIEGTHNILIDTSVSSAVLVENPPSFSAPQIILDVQELPRHASQTQCPFCHEYITTDVTKTVSSTSYLMSFIFIMFCCVAGCCLLPFCLDTCKDVVHSVRDVGVTYTHAKALRGGTCRVNLTERSKEISQYLYLCYGNFENNHSIY